MSLGLRSRASLRSSACSISLGTLLTRRSTCAGPDLICGTPFRYKPQTQQGADILADELKAQVLMPDFFDGDEPWPLDKFPPKTDEDKKKLQEWFGGYANPANHVPRFTKVAQALKDEGVQFVLGYGYCWGGKVVIKAGAQSNTPFDAISIIHPA